MSVYMDVVIATTVRSDKEGWCGSSSVLSPAGRVITILMYLVAFASSVRVFSSGFSGVR
jgi:hypothetical protein